MHKSYGFFQEYYVSHLNVSPANASWIGALQMFLVHFLAMLSGRTMDAGYLRYCIATGCFFQVMGALATSFGTKLWHFWLAQGVVSGIGHGLLFSPMIALYATYFKTKRVMAVSLASCGAATGGMVFPVIAYKCLNVIGFAWTVRVMTLIILVNSVIIVTFTRSRIKPRKPPPWVDFSAFRERPYLLFSIGSFLIFEGIYFAYIYVSFTSFDPFLELTTSAPPICPSPRRIFSNRLTSPFDPDERCRYPLPDCICIRGRSVVGCGEDLHCRLHPLRHRHSRVDRRAHPHQHVCLGHRVRASGQLCPKSIARRQCILRLERPRKVRHACRDDHYDQ